MNSYLIEFQNQYKKISLDILEKYQELNSKPMIENFLLKWIELHKNIFTYFPIENSLQLEPNFDDFLKNRTRLFSGVLQSLNRQDSLIGILDQDIIQLKELLKIHDDFFQSHLKQLLSYYSQELIKVQRYRKVKAAYDYALAGD